MFNLDLYTAIAVFTVVSIHLLKCSNHEMTLNRWLSPFSVGWILAGLTMFLPMVQKGALAPTAAVYFLMGALIVNTLVLSFCSRLPNRFADIKSPTIEMMGGIILKLIGTGLCVIFKQVLVAVFQQIDAMIERYRRNDKRLSAA